MPPFKQSQSKTRGSSVPIAQERVKLAMQHPLFTQTVLLPTSPIEELYRIVRRIVVLRETGCCFTAWSGVGKTSALDMVLAMLKSQMPELCIVKHDTHNQQFPSIRAFFKHFLTSVGHKEQRGETYDLRMRLVNLLIDEARRSGMNMVLMSIDEAQAMKEQDFDFLKDIFNDLQRAGIQLVTILMGQDPELLDVIADLRAKRRLDLIGRFAIRVLRFRALNCLADLDRILSEIDRAVYPEGSTLTWSEFFFPQAYSAGFRLQNEAPKFMEAIRSIASVTESEIFDFPARQAFLAIRTFLIDNAMFDDRDMRLPEGTWKEAVAYAKLQEATRLMGEPTDAVMSIEK